MTPPVGAWQRRLPGGRARNRDTSMKPLSHWPGGQDVGTDAAGALPRGRRPGSVCTPMPPRRRKRLDPALFNLPVDRMRQGDYSDESAAHTRDVLRADAGARRVTMQVSTLAGGLLGGM